MTPLKSVQLPDTSNSSHKANQVPLRDDAITIVTTKNVPVGLTEVWDSLMFYEQIDRRPPLLLRLLLPDPIRSEGSKESVGDVATCVYANGHLLKQVTRTIPNALYEFQVIEQELQIGGGLRLMGGSYKLSAVSQHQTAVSVTTRYLSQNRPRRLWRPLEATVCHAFHRYLLAAIQRKAALVKTQATAP